MLEYTFMGDPEAEHLRSCASSTVDQRTGRYTRVQTCAHVTRHAEQIGRVVPRVARVGGTFALHMVEKVWTDASIAHSTLQERVPAGASGHGAAC